MERKIKKELNQMCNLSNYVEEIGIKKGMGEEENAIAYIYDCVKKNAILLSEEILEKLNIEIK